MLSAFADIFVHTLYPAVSTLSYTGIWYMHRHTLRGSCAAGMFLVKLPSKFGRTPCRVSRVRCVPCATRVRCCCVCHACTHCITRGVRSSFFFSSGLFSDLWGLHLEQYHSVNTISISTCAAYFVFSSDQQQRMSAPRRIILLYHIGIIFFSFMRHSPRQFPEGNLTCRLKFMSFW